jgi:hypothetical protein
VESRNKVVATGECPRKAVSDSMIRKSGDRPDTYFVPRDLYGRVDGQSARFSHFA